ncbi:MAG: hypothetical protein NC078_04160 [Ruminococcus sp.]|nr:hypothetical protein [Ruminococcus sp.]
MDKVISYGLNNLYYALKADSGYNAPKSVPGAVKISLSPEEYALTFTGLDGIPKNTANILYGYKGTLTIAGLTADFYRDIYGYELSDEAGLVQKVTSSYAECALLFETQGEPVSRHLYYSCFFGGHEFTAETKGKSVSVTSVNVPVTVRADSEKRLKRILFDDSSERYINWFKEVK